MSGLVASGLNKRRKSAESPSIALCHVELLMGTFPQGSILKVAAVKSPLCLLISHRTGAQRNEKTHQQVTQLKLLNTILPESTQSYTSHTSLIRQIWWH